MPPLLLDRLLDSSDESTSVNDPETTSILRRLARLLNSRKGMSPACPQYGLPALTNHRIDNLLVGEMVKSMQECIEHFEPRLCKVQVTWIRKDFSTKIEKQWPKNQSDCFWASFRISAQRVSDQKPIDLCAEQQHDGDVILHPFEG